jgi:mono/diheme cytochrome c family protein
MRGMVERSLAATYAEEESLTTGDVIAAYTDVFEKWQKADERVLVVEGPVPPPTPETIERGRIVFMDATTGNCVSCHGADGRGDGASAFQADPETGVVTPAYKDDWGEEIIPRNLRYGLFRGGRRPVDLYRRIKNGIAGTPMPEAASTLTNDDIWALVHYVGAISERPRRIAAAHAPDGGHADPAAHTDPAAEDMPAAHDPVPGQGQH